MVRKVKKYLSCFILVGFLLQITMLFPPVWASHGTTPNTTPSPEPEDSPDQPPDCGGCPSESSGCGGQKVNFWDGREQFAQTDLVLPGLIPIVMTRSYDNMSQYDSALGFGWSLSYNERLYEYKDGTVIIRRDCGERGTFIPDGGGYQSPSVAWGTLYKNQDDTFTLKSGKRPLRHYDEKGRLASIEDASGNQLVFTYDPSGRLPLKGIPRDGLSQDVVSVSLDYRLIRIEEQDNQGQPTGRYVDLTYKESTGRLEKIEDSSGRTTGFKHDETSGNLIEVTDVMGELQEFKYEDPNDIHNVTTFSAGICSECNTYTIEYDDQDRALSESYAGGGMIEMSYDIPYMQTTVTKTIKDNEGAVLHVARTTYEFNEKGNPTKITDALGNQTVYERYPDGKLKEKKIYENKGTPTEPDLTRISRATFVYDTDGNITEEKTYLLSGEIITRAYTYEHGWLASEAVVSSLEPDKVFKTEYEFYYDAFGFPTDIRFKKVLLKEGDPPEYLVTEYQYDDDGLLKKIIYPNDDEKDFIYTNGYLTTADGIQFINDSRGNPEYVIDRKGNSTHYVYDDQNRIKEITNPRDEKTIFNYTGENLTRIEYGRVDETPGHFIYYHYDVFDRLEIVERQTETGRVKIAQFTYDSEGNRLSFTNAEEKTTRYSYDALNRLETIMDPINPPTKFEYDALGNRTKIIDANNNSTDYTYDALSRLISVTDAQPYTTAYTYDAMGNLTSVTDARTKTTRYAYDPAGRMIAESRPIGPPFQYFYDPKGRLDYKIDANNQRTDYKYTSRDWFEKIIYNTDPIRTVTFTHDANGNIETWSDDSIQPGGPIYTYTYDKLNRVDTLTNHLVGKSLDYDYDPFGNREKLVLKEGETEVFANTYLHNKQEQLTHLYESPTQFMRFMYYPTGRLKTKYFPGELVRAEYDYFDDGNFKTIAYKKSDETVLSSFAYSYDNIGNVDDMTDLEGLHDYGYDKVYQITSATQPSSPAETYTYDPADNRKTSAEYPDWSYDDNNRLKTYNGVSFEYDNNGNTVKKTENQSIINYHYDYANRLRQVHLPDTRVAKYTYDYLGRRIKKDVDGVVTWYLYDKFTMLAELDGSGTINARYTFTPDGFEPLSLIKADNTYLYTNDHLGTPQKLTTVNGAVVWSADYTSFGETEVEISSSIVNNLRFIGQFYDEETGLHYNYFRFYDPKTGRYLTPDPIGLSGGLNLYAYVLNDPINAIDPFGLYSWYSEFNVFDPNSTMSRQSIGMWQGLRGAFLSLIGDEYAANEAFKIASANSGHAILKESNASCGVYAAYYGSLATAATAASVAVLSMGGEAIAAKLGGNPEILYMKFGSTAGAAHFGFHLQYGPHIGWNYVSQYLPTIGRTVSVARSHIDFYKILPFAVGAYESAKEYLKCSCK
jgi:RHS repeat-associated protein